MTFHFILYRIEMKIAVLGATGPSGIQLVQEALERGHEVTAIVRNPEKMAESVKDEKLKVILLIKSYFGGKSLPISPVTSS